MNKYGILLPAVVVTSLVFWNHSECMGSDDSDVNLVREKRVQLYGIIRGSDLSTDIPLMKSIDAVENGRASAQDSAALIAFVERAIAKKDPGDIIAANVVASYMALGAKNFEGIRRLVSNAGEDGFVGMIPLVFSMVLPNVEDARAFDKWSGEWSESLFKLLVEDYVGNVRRGLLFGKVEQRRNMGAMIVLASRVCKTDREEAILLACSFEERYIRDVVSWLVAEGKVVEVDTEKSLTQTYFENVIIPAGLAEKLKASVGSRKVRMEKMYSEMQKWQVQFRSATPDKKTGQVRTPSS